MIKWLIFGRFFPVVPNVFLSSTDGFLHLTLSAGG